MGVRRRPVYTQTAMRRAVTAILGIGLVLVVGTEGFHYIVGLDYVDAFYFESMLASGQGPPLALTSDAGKIFASAMAFISVTSVITTLVFTLGPIFAMVWRESIERVETKARQFEKELETTVEKTRDPKETD